MQYVNLRRVVLLAYYGGCFRQELHDIQADFKAMAGSEI